MDHCQHVAAYYHKRATIYRSLSWWRLWEMARRENQRYGLLAVGVVDDE